MDTKNVERYAPEARRDFIQAVTDRAAAIGIRPDGDDIVLSDISVQGDVALIEGRPFPRNLAQRRKAIVERMRQDGFHRTVEAAAYTWFNRFIALRYMELHGYLDHGFRVLCHPSGDAVPEILQQAERVELPGLDSQDVVRLRLDGTRDEELYRKLLVAQCNDLHRAMPFLFEPVNDASELLLPDNLLHTNSLIRRLVQEIPEGDWQQAEVVGWIYQFYIKDRADEVIGKVVHSEDIPAATQRFTPNWIVQYLVQNSLGRQWMATYPDSPLREHMPYYIESAEQTEDVQRQLAEITPDHLNPEELTVMDPACGSGHMLIEAYNLLLRIYQERGFRRRDIPRLILEKNLHGLDIDGRAAQLAGFALLMRAVADDRRLLRGRVELSVAAIQHTKDVDTTQVALHLGLAAGDVRPLIDAFSDADTYGTLIELNSDVVGGLDAIDEAVGRAIQRDDILAAPAARSVAPLTQQARLLAAQYDVVVTNPPYMGRRYYDPHLKRYVDREWVYGKADLYGCFILRGLSMCRPSGHLAMLTIPNWMFLSTFEPLRTTLITNCYIDSLVHNGRGVFGSDFGTCSFVVRHASCTLYHGTYRRLFSVQGSVAPVAELQRRFFEVDDFAVSASEYARIPGHPIAYWVDERIRDIFGRASSLHETAAPKQGLATADNDRFLRRWWEVDIARLGFGMGNADDAQRSGKRWFPYNKGGEFRKWYGNNEFVVDWEHDGAAIRAFADDRGKVRSRAQNTQYYFRPSVTWSFTSASYFGVRRSDPGFLFDVAGSSVFPPAGQVNLYAGYLCTSLVFHLMQILNPTLSFQVGDVGSLPVIPTAFARIKPTVDRIVEQAVNIARTDWDGREVSWDFQFSPLVRAGERDGSVADCLAAHDRQCNSALEVLRELEEQNNRTFISAFDLEGVLAPDVTQEHMALTRPDRLSSIRQLASYAVGCAMGRYSLDEPGLIYAESGGEGFDPARHAMFPATEDGILVVTPDEWFDDDAANRFEEFLKVACPEATLEQNLTFVADSLKPRKSDTSRQTIRRYFAQGFFKDHLQTYKRRPIYWLFTSGKKRAFQALVYLHRYNESTLARMRTEYVIPLMRRMGARVEQLQTQRDSDDLSTTRARQMDKELTALADQQAELRAFDEQLQHYAERQIHLDLDDGVKVNYGKFGSLLSDVKAVTGK